MTDRPTTPASAARHAVQQLAEAARKETAALKDKFTEAAESQKAWELMLTYLDRDWHLHFLRQVDQVAPRLRRMRDESHPAIPAIEAAYKQAKEQASVLLRRFPAVLADAFQAAGLVFDPDSRHPRYTLRDRFLSLEIDDQARMARLSTTEGRIAEMPADVDALVQRVRDELKRLFDRRFNGKSVHRAIRKQYLAIAKRLKQPDGSSVPIRQITQRMSKNAKGFRRDEFLVDLAQLLKEGPLEVDGYRLDLQQTRNTNDGVLLPGEAGRGYVGFIVFQKE